MNCRDDGTNETPLMWAVRGGHRETADLLLQRGANVNCRNSKDETVLYLIPDDCRWADNHLENWGSESYRLETVMVLKKVLYAGADVRVVDAKKETPIQRCEEIILLDPKSDKKCVSKLVHVLYSAGVDFNVAIVRFNRMLDHKCPIYFAKFMINDQEPLLPLTGLCRRYIRAHLLSTMGGNHNNLVISVPKLPLPKRLIQFLLFETDMHDLIDSFTWQCSL